MGDFSILFGLKTTAFLALLSSMLIIYHWSKKNFTLTFIFFIPLAYTSIALLYLGIFFAPFFFLSMYALHKSKIILSIASFAIAIFIKQFPLIILPFFITYLFHLSIEGKKINTSPLRMAALIVLIFGGLSALLYGLFGKAFIHAVILGFQEENLVYQALNFNQLTSSLLTTANPQTLIYIAKGTFLFFFISTLLVFITKRKKTVETFLLFSLVGHFSYFIFSKGVHENHLYLSMLLAICLATINSKYLLLALNITLIHTINLLITYGITGLPPGMLPINDVYQTYESISTFQRDIQLFDISLWISGFNVIVFIVLWAFVLFFETPPQENPTTV